MPVRKRTRSKAGSLLEPGRNCWRIERTGRASLIVDAADYFRIAREAMLRAQSQILLIGWDFDTRIELVKEGDEAAPVKLGPFLTWLSRRKPGLRIHILAWDGKLYSFLGRGTTLFRLAEWRLLKPRIKFRLDAAHPLKGCHHHKIMVIDDSFACCGGIDMTGSRWDTRAHCDEDPGRRRPTTGRAYGPWHDAAMAVDADAARALGELGRKRWNIACQEQLEPPSAPGGTDAWPDQLEPQFRDVEIAIARSRAPNGEKEELREIEALFVDMIGAARRWVYIESQYFASRRVAEAIAERLGEKDGPEFVIVNPESADGWLEEAVMGGARAALMKALEAADRHGRFRIYTPVAEAGTPIYVHAKIMIVDERMLRVGSANLNNRSMGLDSECDLMIDADRSNDPRCADEIARRRCDLLAEHLGALPEEVTKLLDETGSLIATIERLRGKGRTLVPFEPPEYSAATETLAKSEAADPDGVDAPFEPTASHRLLRNLRWRRRRGAGA